MSFNEGGVERNIFKAGGKVYHNEYFRNLNTINTLLIQYK